MWQSLDEWAVKEASFIFCLSRLQTLDVFCFQLCADEMALGAPGSIGSQLSHSSEPDFSWEEKNAKTSGLTKLKFFVLKLQDGKLNTIDPALPQPPPCTNRP